MNLGAMLRQARGARKLTCEQLSRTTRIPLRIIVAMEQDQWTKVPGGIFARGYLRAYAHEVGLDGDALAAQFDAEHAPTPALQEDLQPTATSEPEGAVARWRWPALPGAANRWATWPALLALLLLVYLSGRWSIRDGAQPPASPVPAAAGPTSALGERAAYPIGTAAPLEAPDAPRPAATEAVSNRSAVPGDVRLPSSDRDVPLSVDVTVTRSCWVTASADGTRTIYRMLHPGERIQTRGRVLALRVGDAGALQLSLDGEPARALGASGEVVSVRITRDNYRSLLQPGSRN
jgi:cytoskeleton protein RodZ